MTIYVVICTSTTVDLLAGEEKVYKSVDRAFFKEEDAKAFCASRNVGSSVYSDSYDYEMCEVS